MKYIPLKYIKEDPGVGNADDSTDARESTGMLGRLVADLRGQIEALSPGADALRRADLELQLGRALVRLEKGPEAWEAARKAFDLYLAGQAWEGAAQACDILFLADQPQSLAALGQGIWLAVTYPVDPELSVALLQHVVEETPPDSDGAAVAAVTVEQSGLFTADELGLALGLENAIHAVLLEGGRADRWTFEVERLAGFRPLLPPAWGAKPAEDPDKDLNGRGSAP